MFFLKVELWASPSERTLFPSIIRESLEFVIVGRSSRMGESMCGASFPLLSSGIFGLGARMHEMF